MSDSQEFFPFAGAWDVLAASAKKRDPKAFHQAAGVLEIARPIGVLRGLAYMVYLSEQTPKDEVDSNQMGYAMMAIYEVISLVAAMLEHQNEAGIDALCQNHRPIDSLAELNAKMRGTKTEGLRAAQDEHSR